MTSTVGKITGQMLENDLQRDGVDLAFDTDLIYLDVDNDRIGIKNTIPLRPLHVTGATRTGNLIVDTTFTIPNFVFNYNTITNTVSSIVLSSKGSITTSQLATDGISINDNYIKSTRSNENLDLTASGSGVINLKKSVEVFGNLHSSGNVTFDGSIIFGNSSTDKVDFNSDVASNIVPDLDLTYSLDSATRRWKDLYTYAVNGNSLTALSGFSILGIEITLRPGNTWYVSTNGGSSNFGDHPQSPFDKISEALANASSGDTVYIFPGTYFEELPLTVPAGVTVKGFGVRSVTVKPDTSSAGEDVFLLNGESTVEDITIADFYYNSSNDTGYAFRFAPGMTVTTRSPYIRNSTVLTKGSITSVSDPRGYNQGDAGRGAKIDGSVVNAASKEASMLFHSVTFITPGVRCLWMTNGVRVEWLNCFIYFASEGLYAAKGTLGFASDGKTRLKLYGISSQTVLPGATVSIENVSQANTYTTGIVESISYSGAYSNVVIDGYVSGFEASKSPPDTSNQQRINFSGGQTASHLEWVDYSDFGAEVRSIGSANVYGSIGAKADGDGTLMYLISHNFGYIGSGKLSTNDTSDVIDSNETVELNNGKIYYQSMDQEGNFRVGDIFKVESATGRIVFQSNLFTSQNISITDGTNITYADPNEISTGNITITGNTIQSNSGGITLNAANQNLSVPVNFTTNSNLTASTDTYLNRNVIIGSDNTDSIYFYSEIASNFIPDTNLLSLGLTSKRWKTLYATNLTFDDILIDTNFITTTLSNSNLQLDSNGTGQVYLDAVSITGNTISGGPSGSVFINPNGVGTIQLQKDTSVTGNLDVTGSATVAGNIQIGDNVIDTINPVGRIGSDLIPFTTALYDIGSNAYRWNNIYLAQAITDSIIIDTNVIQSIESNANLELRVNGTGNVRIDTLDFKNNSIISNTTNSDIQINPNGTGIVQLLKNTNITGNLTVSGTVNFNSNTQFGDTNSDVIIFNTKSISDANPFLTTLYDLGSNSLKWNNIFLDRFVTDSIIIDTNVIQSIESNANLELRVNGTGNVRIDTLDFKNNSIISNTTNSDIQINPNGTGTIQLLKNTNITGTLTVWNNLTINGDTQFGDSPSDSVTLITGIISDINPLTTGSYDLGSDGLRWGATFLDQLVNDSIIIDSNVIQSIETNANIELRANGTGRVLFEDVNINDNIIATDSNNILYINPNGIGSIQLAKNTFANTNFFVSGTTLLNSNTQLGDNPSDTVYFNSRNINNFIPFMNSTYDLGNDILRWNIYLDELVIDDLVINTNFISSTLSNSNLELRANGAGRVLFEDITINDNIIGTDSNNILYINPNGTGTIQLLKNTVANTNFYLSGLATFNSNTQFGDSNLDTLNFNTRSISDFNPFISTVYDLGSYTLRWNNIYTDQYINDFVNVDTNIIQSLESNANLELRANGTGRVLFEDVNINDNIIATDSNNILYINPNGTGTIQLQKDTVANTNFTVSGISTFNSNTQFGDSANDTLTMNSRTVSDVNPAVSGNYDLGSDSLRWQVLYSDQFINDNIIIDTNIIRSIESNANLEFRANGTGRVLLEQITVNDNIIGTDSNSILYINPDGTGTVQFLKNTFANTNFTVSGNTTLYSNTQFGDSGTDSVTLNTRSISDVNPSANTVYDLGNDSLRWQVVYIDQLVNDAIVIDTNVIKSLDSNDNLIFNANGSGNVVFEQVNLANNSITTYNNQDLLINPNGTGAIRLQKNTAITGSLSITGNVNVGGNVQIGDQTLDNINVIGRIGSDIMPNLNAVYDIGSDTKRWNNLYLDELTIDSFVFNTGVISSILSNQNLELRANGSGIIRIDQLDISSNLIYSNTTNTNILITPNGTGKIQLEKNTAVTGNLDVTGNVSIGGNVQIGDVLIDTINPVGKISSDLVPLQTAIYDIGTASFRWNTLYVSKLINDEIEIDGNLIRTTASNQNLELDANGTGRVLFESINLTNNIISTLNTNQSVLFNPNGLGKIILDADTFINANFTLPSSYYFSQNINLGSSINNTVSLNGTVNTDINPYLNSVYNLGNPGRVWNNLQASQIWIDDIRIDTNIIQSILSNQNLELRANGTGSIRVDALDFKNNTIISNSTNTDIQITPNGTGTIQLLKNTAITGNLDVSGNVSVGGNVQLGDVILDNINPIGSVSSNILPSQNSVYDLGTSSLPWRNMFFSQGIINDIQIDDNLVRTVRSNADLELRANGSGQVRITDNFAVNQNLSVTGNSLLNNLTVLGTTTTSSSTNFTNTVSAAEFSVGLLEINDNYIRSTGNPTLMVDYLVVAGGGGGGRDIGGGGGAGGLLQSSATLSVSSSYSITVGQGGAGSTTTSQKGGNGLNSSISGPGVSITATGGGGGNSRGFSAGGSGGSGGGGATVATTAGSGTAGQGNSGASGAGGGSFGSYGGGGGGAGGAGSGKNGGSGLNFSTWASATGTGSGGYYAGGGAGGIHLNNDGYGSPGLGGGGQASNEAAENAFGGNGEPNTGGGGGGQSSDGGGGGGNGGSGIVIIRYGGTQRATGGTVVTTGGYTYHTFTASGSFVATGSTPTLELRGNANGGVIFDDYLQITNSVISNLRTSGIETERSIIFAPTASNIKINSTISTLIPIGDNTNRVLSLTGEIRSNPTNQSFEGYVPGGTRSLNGLYDIDRNTYITAEATVGAGDNTIRFYNNNVLTANITQQAVTFNKVVVDEINLDNNLISTVNSNADIVLDPSGTALLRLKDDFSITNNIITNLTSNGVTDITYTGDGYVAFIDTKGVVFPSGTDAQRLASPPVGAMRWNTDRNLEEVYNGTTWVSVSGSEGAITDETMGELGNLYSLIFG